MTLGTTITTMTLASDGDGDGVGALKKQEEVLKRLKVVSVDKNLICLLRQTYFSQEHIPLTYNSDNINCAS